MSISNRHRLAQTNRRKCQVLRAGQWAELRLAEWHAYTEWTLELSGLTMRFLRCSRDEQQYAESLRESATGQSLLGSVWRSATGSSGPPDTARLLPASAVSFVILVAAMVVLWQRRALLRRKCRELRHGRDAVSRDHSSQQHGRHNGVVSLPDSRSLLSRKQSA